VREPNKRFETAAWLQSKDQSLVTTRTTTWLGHGSNTRCRIFTSMMVNSILNEASCWSVRLKFLNGKAAKKISSPLVELQYAKYGCAQTILLIGRVATAKVNYEHPHSQPILSVESQPVPRAVQVIRWRPRWRP